MKQSKKPKDGIFYQAVQLRDDNLQPGVNGSCNNRSCHANGSCRKPSSTKPKL